MMILMVITAPTPGFVINNAAGGGGMQIKFDGKDFQMPNFNPNDFKMLDIPKGNPVGNAAGTVILEKQDQLTPQDPFDTVKVASRAKRFNVDLQAGKARSEEHTSELQSPDHLVC